MAKKSFGRMLAIGVAVLLVIAGVIMLIANPREDASVETDPIESEQAETEGQVGTEEETESLAETESEPVSQPEEEPSALGYMGYNGYLDECKVWTSAKDMFGDCDFDADGRKDRVYRTVRENAELCHYRIEFGNGEVLSFDKDVYDVGEPKVEGVDLTGDGENEIILYLTPITSTAPQMFGDIVIYERIDGTYRKATLPFEESEEGYAQMLSYVTDNAEGQAVEVSIPERNDLWIVPIDDELWEEYDYEDFYSTRETSSSPVWDYEIIRNTDGNQLLCKVHLFDKWSGWGLDVALNYVDGKFVIDKITLTE